jgi:hypothetical protein
MAEVKTTLVIQYFGTKENLIPDRSVTLTDAPLNWKKLLPAD